MGRSYQRLGPQKVRDPTPNKAEGWCHRQNTPARSNPLLHQAEARRVLLGHESSLSLSLKPLCYKMRLILSGGSFLNKVSICQGWGRQSPHCPSGAKLPPGGGRATWVQP